MKIKITADAKKILHMSDAEAVQEINASFADQKDLKWEAETAVTLAIGGCDEIYAISPEFARNCRIINYYGDNTGDVDIWVTVKAFSRYHGFAIVGFYLSDIWQLGSENRDEIRSHLYIDAYTRQK